MSAPAEPQSKLAQTAISACLAYNTWDLDTIMANRHPDAYFQVLPASMGRGRLNNEEYRQWFGTVLTLFKNFKVTIRDVIEDAARHKAVVHVDSEAQTILGPYKNEYVVIIKTTDDDEKVLELLEFVDSAYSNDYFGRLRAALAEKAKAVTTT